MIAGKRKKYLKVKRLIENIYPLVISVIITCISFFYLSNYKEFHVITQKLLSDSLLSLIITIESAIFGFLLTILALIFQMNNKTIDIIKEFGRFNELVRFSKVAVYSSLIAVILSLTIMLFINSECNLIFAKTIKYIFGFFLIYNLLSTLRFVNIFYLLAKSK